MPRRKIQDRNIRKISRIGDRSLGITLPVGMLRWLKWREKQKVVVSLRGKKIIIEDWEKQFKI